MATPTLDETLLALLGAVDPPEPSGIVVTEVDMTIPLEATFGDEHGELVVRAGVPHTRWVSGFLPPVHTAHLHIELMPEVHRAPRPAARLEVDDG
ncbi:hypothetical protein [Pendulispora albinea]|uniref:Uncharacterized protein n=1 Tax=Pendulispora albinea TaxID=2741071 RepID=A0ABZ2M0I6_9BACT